MFEVLGEYSVPQKRARKIGNNDFISLEDVE